MTRVIDFTVVALVSALSIASVFLTHELFVFTTNIPFETLLIKKEYSQPFSYFSVFFSTITHDYRGPRYVG